MLVGIASTLAPLGSAAGGRAERVSTVNSLLDERPAAPGDAVCRSAGARSTLRPALNEVSDGMPFDDWIGACRTDDPVCSLTLNEPTSVTAKFNRKAVNNVLEGLPCKRPKTVSHFTLESIVGGFVCAGT